MRTTEARQTLAQFVAKHKITARAEYRDSNPNMPDFEGNHWNVTLRRGLKRMTIPFSQGYGISSEPTAEDVLNCLASDSSCYENSRTLEDWCDELGYDSDSRKAERTYRACASQATRLAKFLGSDLYHALLWETEGL